MSPLKPTNLAITTNPSHELNITAPPIPSPNAGECLIHVRATGICGSDVHFWKKGGIGSSKVTGELGLGHESAGVVVGVGEGVEGWRVGEFDSFPGFSIVCLNPHCFLFRRMLRLCQNAHCAVKTRSLQARTTDSEPALPEFPIHGYADFLSYTTPPILLQVLPFKANVCHANEKPPGDRVALENGIPCSRPSCKPCRTGHYHACPDMVFFSSPPVHGTLRRYHAHPAAWLHRLPDNLSLEEGALLEPLSVALAGIERSGLKLGDSLVICGAGPIGLVNLLAANAAGAAPIVITDLDENRLGMAKKLVPRVRTLRVENELAPEVMAEKVKEALGEEAGLVVECTGVESSIHSAIYVSLSRWSPYFLVCRLPELLTDDVAGSSVRRFGVHHRVRQRLFDDSVHACIVPGDRYSFPVPIP